MTTLSIPQSGILIAGSQLTTFLPTARLQAKMRTLDQVDAAFLQRWSALHENSLAGSRIPAPGRLMPVLQRLNRVTPVMIVSVETADTWQHLTAVGVFERFHLGTLFPVRYLSTNLGSLMLDQRIVDRSLDTLLEFLKDGRTWNGVSVNGRRNEDPVDRAVFARARMKGLGLIRASGGVGQGTWEQTGPRSASNSDLLATTSIGSVCWRMARTFGWP